MNWLLATLGILSWWALLMLAVRWLTRRDATAARIQRRLDYRSTSDFGFRNSRTRNTTMSAIEPVPSTAMASKIGSNITLLRTH